MGGTAQAITPHLRTNLLICACFRRGLGGSRLAGQVLLALLDGAEEQVDQFTPLTRLSKHQAVFQLLVGHRGARCCGVSMIIGAG